MTLRVKVTDDVLTNGVTTVANTAQVTLGDEDPIVSEASSETIPVYNPSMSITKTLTNTSEMVSGMFEIGSTIRYNIVITNTGNCTLTNVVVNDTMTADEGAPAGTVVLTADSGYTVTGTTITVDSLAVGASVTVPAQYVVQSDDSTKVLTNAAIGTAGTKDPSKPTVNASGTAEPAQIGLDPNAGYEYEGTIKVTKYVTKNNKSQAVNDTIYVALFDTNGNMVEGTQVQAITLAGTNTGSTTFAGLPTDGTTYKVVEVNESGEAVAEGQSGFEYESPLYSNQTITLTADKTSGTASIENQIGSGGSSTEVTTTTTTTSSDSTTTTTSGKSVKTGDDTNLMLYFMLLMIAMISAIGAVIYRKKRRI